MYINSTSLFRFKNSFIRHCKVLKSIRVAARYLQMATVKREKTDTKLKRQHAPASAIIHQNSESSCGKITGLLIFVWPRIRFSKFSVSPPTTHSKDDVAYPYMFHEQWTNTG
jgi:hypothetical protein